LLLFHKGTYKIFHNSVAGESNQVYVVFVNIK